MTMEKLLFNDILSMSLFTGILEAADWDESVAERISFIIRNTQPASNLELSLDKLEQALILENIPKNVISNIFMLIKLELARIKSRPKL